MVERRQPSRATREEAPPRRTAASGGADVRAELEDSLEINRDDLDTCLVGQPGFFYHVAEQVAAANARRDTTKLELEELMAEEDGKFRAVCARSDEKVTENGIRNYVQTLDSVKQLQRELLSTRMEADKWQALKEAYQQRSFMLRELVALFLSQMHNLGVERGASSLRHELGDNNRARGEAVRREQRQSRE
jgi:hypothetical protein